MKNAGVGANSGARKGSRLGSAKAPRLPMTERVRAVESERQSLVAILTLVRSGGATTGSTSSATPDWDARSLWTVWRRSRNSA